MNDRRQRRGLRLSTWLVALIAVCVLPPLAVAAWLAVQSIDALAELQDREARAKAGSVATAIDQELQARLGALQMMAQAPQFLGEIVDGSPLRVALAFHQAFGGHVVLAEVGAQPDEPMRMLLNTRVPHGQPLPQLPRPSGRAAAPTALQTGLPTIGDLFTGPIAGEPLLALAMPVQRSGGPPRVLLNTPEARRFQQRLDQVTLPPDWALSLLDSQGELIARRAPAGFVPAPPGEHPGRHRLPLAAARWTVELEIPDAVRLAPARHAAEVLIAALAGATLLAAAAGVLAARRLRRGVAALADPAADADASAGVVELAMARRRLDLASRRRDEALAAARAAEARLRDTFELAHVGIAHVSLEGHWLRVNRRLCEITGYSEAQLLVTTFQDITHPDDLAADLAQVQQLLAGQIPAYGMDKRYRRRDGREVWVALAVALARRADGSPDYFISVVEDIGERKRLEQQTRQQYDALARSEAETRRLLTLAEGSRGALLNVLQDQQQAARALQASEARLRNVFEQASDGIFVIDADNRYLDANRSGLAMLGYSRDELLRLGLADVLAPHELQRLAVARPPLLDGETQLSEWDHVRRDGTVFPGEVSAKRLDEHSYIAVVRDLTERRRAEASLRASEAYRRRLLEQMADGVLLVDAQGLIADANPGADAILGSAAGALKGQRLDARLTDAECRRWADELPRMRAGTAALSEWTLRRCDDRLVPAELSARPLDDQNLVVVVRDVSARRAAEQALLRYQVELSELTQRLLEQERATTQQLAQALHDRLGQTLALARLRLGALVLRIDRLTAAERDAAIDQLGKLLAQAVTEARQVLSDLRPPLLEDEGLAAALDNELHSPALAGAAADARLTPALHVSPAALAQRWPAAAEYAAFMVAREAITNALRHAGAGRIDVRLAGGPGWLQLDIEDDGSGLTPELAQGRPGHLGIVGMRERALAIGAHFTVARRTGGGTCVSLSWHGNPR